MLDQHLQDARILLVDDEEANVELLEQLLTRAGYTQLLRTTDAREALPLYARYDPDLILLDLLMPHLDGYAVLERLQQLVPAEAYVPVLVLTADITPAAKQRALGLGAKDFLTKPFDRTELLLRVKNLLETRLLFMQLQRQNAGLQRLYDEAQVAARRREETQAALSHDLGQPVTVLRITSRLLHRDAARGETVDSAVLLRHLETLDATTTRLLGLTSELVDLARLQAGQPLELNLQPVDLVALVNNEVSTQQLTTSQHRISVESAEPEIVGEWDAVRLSRVLANLLNNAIKYSPAGGVITVSVARECDDVQRRVLVRVQDTGLGIPAADLPLIARRFYRASNVAGRLPGTGIGLMGARHIVEQHGGELAVASTESVGTTVTIWLPLD